MKISDVARHFKINPQTIYFYERIGLIPPPKRNQAGYRIFENPDMDRLGLIERAKTLGLSLEEIREILQLKEGHGLTCDAVHQKLAQKLEEIEIKITQLQELRQELLPLVQRCEHTLTQDQHQTDCGVFLNEQTS